MSDTATATRRTGPPQGEVVTEIPESSRQGAWKVEFDWFQANPGLIKKYEGVSVTTASYLRKEYGLDAKTRNSKGGRCDLYVSFDPDKAEAIKRASAERGAKVAASRAANKATNASKTAGTRK